MSLVTPHPILTSAGSSPYHVSMANIQCLMLSGRYRTEALCSHWSESGDKFCKSSNCKEYQTVEDLPHILATCGSLQATREKLMDFTAKYKNTIEISVVQDIISTFCSTSHPSFCQFLIDCSVLPEVITAAQNHGSDVVFHHLFRITRTWCYCLHRETDLRTSAVGRKDEPCLSLSPENGLKTIFLLSADLLQLGHLHKLPLVVVTLKLYCNN